MVASSILSEIVAGGIGQNFHFWGFKAVINFGCPPPVRTISRSSNVVPSYLHRNCLSEIWHGSPSVADNEKYLAVDHQMPDLGSAPIFFCCPKLTGSAVRPVHPKSPCWGLFCPGFQPT